MASSHLNVSTDESKDEKKEAVASSNSVSLLPLLSLPKDLLQKIIFPHLDPNTLREVASTSRIFNHFANNPICWNPYLRSPFRSNHLGEAKRQFLTEPIKRRGEFHYVDSIGRCYFHNAYVTAVKVLKEADRDDTLAPFLVDGLLTMKDISTITPTQAHNIRRVYFLIAEEMISIERAKTLPSDQINCLSKLFRLFWHHQITVDQALLFTPDEIDRLSQLTDLIINNYLTIIEVLSLTMDLVDLYKDLSRAIIKNIIPLKQANKLNSDQRSNFSDSALQDQIINKNLTVEELMEMTRQEGMNFRWSGIYKLIEEKIITKEQAKRFTNKQAENLGASPWPWEFISQGIISYEKVMMISLTSIQRAILGSLLLQDLILNKTISIEEVIPLINQKPYRDREPNLDESSSLHNAVVKFVIEQRILPLSRVIELSKQGCNFAYDFKSREILISQDEGEYDFESYRERRRPASTIIISAKQANDLETIYQEKYSNLTSSYSQRGYRFYKINLRTSLPVEHSSSSSNPTSTASTSVSSSLSSQTMKPS